MENNEEPKVVEEVKEETHESVSAPSSDKKPGLYTAGLVCSIVGLCLFWSVWIGLICGILGIVFGAITLNKTNNKTPIILGSVATGLAIIMMIVYPILVKNVFDKAVDEYKENFTETVKDMEDELEDSEEEEQEKKDADFEQKTNEMEQQVDSKKEDIDASKEELEKQVNDVFNNALH